MASSQEVITPAERRAVPGEELDRALIRSLVTRIRECLDPLLEGVNDVALTIYPHHWNAGDTALWCGTLAILKQMGKRIRYRCDYKTYDPQALSRLLPEGPILINGGGNFGDVYTDERELRQRIFMDFPDRRIIQLPQSLWFLDEKNIADMRAKCRRLRDFHLLVRDGQGLALARDKLEINAVLCPDMSLGLVDLKSLRTPSRCEALWLARSDTESMFSDIPADVSCSMRVEKCDWVLPGGEVQREWRIYDRALLRWNDIMRSKVRLSPDTLQKLTAFSFDRLAYMRVARGVSILSRGGVVISDRLHGHLLALMAGIPFILLPNKNGKNCAFYETWTHLAVGGTWAETPADAFQKAGSLIEKLKNIGR